LGHIISEMHSEIIVPRMIEFMNAPNAPEK